MTEAMAETLSESIRKAAAEGCRVVFLRTESTWVLLAKPASVPGRVAMCSPALFPRVRLVDLVVAATAVRRIMDEESMDADEVHRIVEYLTE